MGETIRRLALSRLLRENWLKSNNQNSLTLLDPSRDPNLFSKQVVQNLYDISGAYPIIRVGGSTQNSAVYFEHQTEAIIAPFSSPADDQPSHSYIGPAFMQSFQQLPAGTQYIYGKHGHTPFTCTSKIIILTMPV